jgi:hypothetical protein
MKIVLIVLGVLVAVAAVGGIVWAVTSSPERSVCIRLAELCADPKDGSADDLDACMESMQAVHEAAGEKEMEKLVTCIDDADTCATASGCMAGTGFNVMTDVMGDFLKGFGKTLGK